MRSEALVFLNFSGHSVQELGDACGFGPNPSQMQSQVPEARERVPVGQTLVLQFHALNIYI